MPVFSSLRVPTAWIERCIYKHGRGLGSKSIQFIEINTQFYSSLIITKVGNKNGSKARCADLIVRSYWFGFAIPWESDQLGIGTRVYKVRQFKPKSYLNEEATVRERGTNLRDRNA
jgi:hypothetical protein